MIRKLEEVAMNAWPSLQTMLVDGWILRFAEGYTYRANSINPIYPTDEWDLNSKIQACEELYIGRSLPVIYKMTSASLPANLDQILDHKGYRLTAASLVLTLDINSTMDLCATVYPIDLNEQMTVDWMDDFCRLNKKNEANKAVMTRMFENRTHKACFMRIFKDREVVACGLGVVEGKFIGLYDIVTHDKSRRQGFGAAIVTAIINWGRLNGAGIAYLQVVQDNIPALHLYYKLGFKKRYDYWYRVKTEESL